MEFDKLISTEATPTEKVKSLNPPDIISPEAFLLENILPKPSPCEAISPVASPLAISPVPSEFIYGEGITPEMYYKRQLIENHVMIITLLAFWVPNIAATFQLTYTFIYEIENTTGKVLIVISMIFPIYGRYLIILLNFVDKSELTLSKALSKILNHLIPIIVFSILGLNDAFPTNTSRFWILYLCRCVQVAFQLTAVCLFTETWGVFLLLIVFAMLFDTFLMIGYVRAKYSGVYNNRIFERKRYLIQGMSKAFLNWFDIITDLIYIATSQFYSPVLLILSVVFLFTGPFLQAIFHLYKVGNPSVSAFIKVYVSSFLGVHELEIGYELMILKKEKKSLQRYFEYCAYIHVLFESVPQLILNILNAGLLGMYTTVNIISAVVSFLVVAKSIISMLTSLCRTIPNFDQRVPDNVSFCEHLILGTTIGISWYAFSMNFNNYCNVYHYVISFGVTFFNCIFCLIIFFLERHYHFDEWNENNRNLSFILFILFYIPSDIYKKYSCLLFICYVFIKFVPMFGLLLSNAICLSHINPFSTVILVLLVHELLYKSTYLNRTSIVENEIQLESRV